MNATNELRAMLDKRGVEYTTNDEKSVKETCWPYMGELIAAFAEYDNGTTCFACDTWCFTPQQAIAATLGDNDATRARQLDAIDEILRTLNAEVANDNIKYDLYSELHDMVGELGNLIESCTEPIAVMLGADECVIERNVDGSYKCPKCGCVVDYDIRGDDERIITMDDYVIPFNFCPSCGAEVVHE